jgi:large subunit ribosomal protein L2
MGKSLIQQARGKGSLTYRVRRKAFSVRIKYPPISEEGEMRVLKLIHSAGHSSPVAKIMINKRVFYNVACNGLYEGKKIVLGKEIEDGNILQLKKLPTKTKIYNIESRPNDGGKFIRSAGGYAIIVKKEKGKAILLMPSKKEKEFNSDCRATVGVVAGSGRGEKPIMKAGKQYYIKKAKGKLWPRTSAVKMNVIDHPFGSGRGKNLSHGRLGKIPRRNSPPGAKVGSVRAKRTGRKKR